MTDMIHRLRAEDVTASSLRFVTTVHGPRLRVVVVTDMNHRLRAEDVTKSSLQFVTTAPLPHAVMIVGMRGEDEIVLFHRSRRGVPAHAQGRLGPPCLSAPATVDPVVEAIKITWIHNVLLPIVITCLTSISVSCPL